MLTSVNKLVVKQFCLVALLAGLAAPVFGQTITGKVDRPGAGAGTMARTTGCSSTFISPVHRSPER